MSLPISAAESIGASALSSLDAILALASGESEDLRDRTTAAHKSEWGQFFTRSAVAAFMAGWIDVTPSTSGVVRVLDPGAGTGVLGLGASWALLRRGVRVHLVAIESETGARARLASVLERAATHLGNGWTYEVRGDDVLDLGTPRLGATPEPPFDVVISNPPYFKMSPSVARGGDAPNAYARFMEVGAGLLRDGGQLVYIVPRSFASGLYFRRFRARFHARMSLERVHVFESRRDAFQDEQVLQENVIVAYRKGPAHGGDVTVSCSAGVADVQAARPLLVPRSDMLRPEDRHAVLTLPTSEDDLAVMRVVQGWPSSLHRLGLEVSTGPVVPFRTDALRFDATDDTVPLLWLQHVRQGAVRWPLPQGFRKQEHIQRNAGDALLVPCKRYILMRRFSAKEEPRRLTLAVLDPEAIGADLVGLENHLNFIHCPRGDFPNELAFGLAAVLSSSLVDTYFRIQNGNTQVSATELRTLPLPVPEVVESIGATLLRAGVDALSRQDQTDWIVGQAISTAKHGAARANG